jgi:hypothetical protein
VRLRFERILDDASILKTSVVSLLLEERLDTPPTSVLNERVRSHVVVSNLVTL